MTWAGKETERPKHPSSNELRYANRDYLLASSYSRIILTDLIHFSWYKLPLQMTFETIQR